MHAPPSSRPLFAPAQRALFAAVARLLFSNPFEPAWESALREALGDRWLPPDGAGLVPCGALRKNLARLIEPLCMELTAAAEQLAAGGAATEEERAAYQGAVVVALWVERVPLFQRLIDEQRVDAREYDEFAAHHHYLLGRVGVPAPAPPHLFALLYQAYRAIYFLSTRLRGASPSAAAARAALYRANLGTDPCVYASSLYRRMDEIPVLLLGETGTGKELAAECLGWSRYLPFDEATRRFSAPHHAGFFTRNLGEVPRELIDAALFGHLRGSFTGADADAEGCLSLPGPHCTLFLDEIGELPESAQVKLLRPLQSRELVPVGERRSRKLAGRHVFATHRDLEALCREGRFRADLYERINGMRVVMPPLRQMLAESPGELGGYVRAFVAAMLDDPAEIDRWSARITASIEASLPGHPWPRNLRELRHVTERALLEGGTVHAPAASPDPGIPAGPPPASPESRTLPSSGLLGPRAKAGETSIDELTRAYVTRMHVLTGQNKAETARRTGLDWRTVSKLLDPVRLARWLRR